MFYVYILYSKGYDSYYVGHTDDVQRRLSEHNSCQNTSTKRYVPWELIGFIEKADKSSAYRLEMKLKNLSKERKKKFIAKYLGN